LKQKGTFLLALGKIAVKKERFYSFQGKNWNEGTLIFVPG
jgi:hypothetical protein